MSKVLMYHLKGPETLGSRKLTLVGSPTANDLSVPTGTKRIHFRLLSDGSSAVPVRIRAGISGTASSTSDATTVVAPTSAYIDVVASADVYTSSEVDLRFTSDVTWCRIMAIGGGPDIIVTFFKHTNALPSEVAG